MTARNGRRAADDATPEPDDPASAEALAARDRTGWPPHPSERRDFYHRIRVFPPEMAGWRKRMVRAIAADPARLRFAAGTPYEPTDSKTEPTEPTEPQNIQQEMSNAEGY